MADKPLKKKAHQVAPKKAPVERPKGAVIVGTYKGKQLAWIKRHGVYNYPVKDGDEFDPKAFAAIKELWLYADVKGTRHVFEAEFVGKMTKTEFLTANPTYAKLGPSRGEEYYVFRTKPLEYGPRLENPIVIVRTADFGGRSQKVKKAIEQFKSDGEYAPLEHYLPAALAQVPCSQLRVCEAAVQMEFLAMTLVQAPVHDSTDKISSSLGLPEWKYMQVDALSFLRTMPNETVQLVLTSPPYNIGKEYEARRSIQQYLAEMKPIVEQIARVLKTGGSVCWQVGNYVDAGEVFPLDIYFYSMFKDVGLRLRNRIIWHFGHGLHCRNRFSGRYETILWFTKGNDYVFNLDDVRIPSKYPGKRYYKGDKKGQLSGNPLGKNPEDVWVLKKIAEDWNGQIWDIPNVKSNHPEKVDHPCQFPIELVERCVLALSKEGDVVYDPFVGVGSTIIGALKNGRIGYGTELERKYIDIGLSRINDLAHGRLKMRPVTQEIFEAEKAGRLSQIPEEWLKKGNDNENR